MYLTRRCRQSAQEFAKKLHKSREFFTKDVSKEADNRITGHENVMLAYTREYNKLTANKYDYCKPDDLKKLLEAKKEILEEKYFLAEVAGGKEENNNNNNNKTRDLSTEKVKESKNENVDADGTVQSTPVPPDSSLTSEISALKSEISKLETSVSRLPETFDENSESTLSLEEYQKKFLKQAQKMDLIFKKHNAGWYNLEKYKGSSREQMPALETDDFKHEVLFIPGYDWLLDTTTRKLPKGGRHGIAQRYPHHHNRTFYSLMKDFANKIFLLDRPKKIRESDKILYYSRFGLTVNPEVIMHKIKTVDNKFDHHGSYSEYMKTINNYYIKSMFINSICVLAVIWCYCYIMYSEWYDDAKIRRSAYFGKFWSLIGINDDKFIESGENKVLEARKMRKKWLEDVAEGKVEPGSKMPTEEQTTMQAIEKRIQMKDKSSNFGGSK